MQLESRFWTLVLLFMGNIFKCSAIKGGHKLTLYQKVKRLVEEGGGVVMADLPQETPQELLVTLFLTILSSMVINH